MCFSLSVVSGLTRGIIAAKLPLPDAEVKNSHPVSSGLVQVKSKLPADSRVIVVCQVRYTFPIETDHNLGHKPETATCVSHSA